MLLIFRLMTSVYSVTCSAHAIKAVEGGLLALLLSFLLAATGIVARSLVVVQKCNMLIYCYLPDKIRNPSLPIFCLLVCVLNL